VWEGGSARDNYKGGKRTTNDETVRLTIDQQVAMRDIELSCKEHTYVRLRMVSVQAMIIKKTSVIGSIKIKGRMRAGLGHQARLARLTFFFSSELADFFFCSLKRV
jgi:hypothetical protein